MKVLDSFAWFEYLDGSKAGARVNDILVGSDTVATPATCVAEIKRKLIREGREWEKEIGFIQENSRVLPLTVEIALRAGDIKSLHFADSLVYATAQEHNAVLVTGDPHFRGHKGVELIK